MKIISIVGARPNFIKIAPFIRAINRHNGEIERRQATGDRLQVKVEHILVHTGQHYDDRMSQSFFDQLEIPLADINLGIGSGSHAEQVGKTMIEFEKVLKSEKPDWVVVVGDVNATLACSVTAKKELIKCCHIEAGLRSGDITMPEEINRLVTDRLSDLLLCPDLIAVKNLQNEGISDKKIKFVGNIMIDTLEANRLKASLLSVNEIVKQNLIHDQLATSNQQPATSDFAVLTLHRPSNVDDKAILSNLIDFVCTKCEAGLTIIWPIHPRTFKRLGEFDLLDKIKITTNLILTQPLGYLEMLRLNISAKLILTDSGGLQEECTVLGTPCLTMRWNTERPITLLENGGASVLVGNNIERISIEFDTAMKKGRDPFRPELWDGHAAERCLEAILEYGNR